MKTNAAIFASDGLGDGLIQLVLAKNLSDAGYEVTFFNDHVAELNDYLPDIDARPFPSYEWVREELSNTHIILYESEAPYTREFPDSLGQWFASNGICYSVSRKNPVHRRVTEKQIRRRLPDGSKQDARRLIAFNRKMPLGSIGLYRKPLSQQLADSLANTLRLDGKSYENGLRVPQSNPLSKSTRVVIHPTSRNASKNWLPSRYLELAGRLKQDGWQPVYTVAPDERDRWLEFTNGIVDVPLFESVKDLADFYSESTAFIGNDSGNAHLASCLGLPNLVIYRRWQRYPRWRPGWTKPVIIYPRVIKNRHWQHKISVDRVYQAFLRMVSKRPAQKLNPVADSQDRSNSDLFPRRSRRLQ